MCVSQEAKKARKEAKASEPKKPMGAFMHYSSVMRQTMKEDHPEASFGEIGKLLGAAWNEVSETERAAYERMAEEDKERYAKECEEAGREIEEKFSPGQAKARAAAKAEKELERAKTAEERAAIKAEKELEKARLAEEREAARICREAEKVSAASALFAPQ